MVDTSRFDPYARRGHGHQHRKLPLSVWYPAAPIAPGADGPPTPYLPRSWRSVSWMWGLRGRRVVTHAVTDAPPADGTFPLVVFSPSANPAHLYTALLEDLASHGFVVAGISHTYEVMPVTAFAHGRPRVVRLAALGGALATPGKRPYSRDLADRAAVVDVTAADIGFVADTLRAEPGDLPLDPVRWAAIGHSFGGGAVAELTRRGSTCRAGVSLDGGLWRRPDEVGAAMPLLQLFAEHPEHTDPVADVVARKQYATAAYAEEDRATTVGAWQALHDAARPGASARVTGATHTSLCDWPLLDLRSWSPARRTLAGVAGPAVWATVAAAARTFLAAHVADDGADAGATGRLDGLDAVPGLEIATPADLFRPS